MIRQMPKHYNLLIIQNYFQLKETIQTNQQVTEVLAKEKRSLKIKNRGLNEANEALKRKETKHDKVLNKILNKWHLFIAFTF
jgi:hypothetical protein